MTTTHLARPDLSGNEESFELNEIDGTPAHASEEVLMPKAVAEGEADDLSTWAWLSAVW